MRFIKSLSDAYELLSISKASLKQNKNEVQILMPLIPEFEMGLEDAGGIIGEPETIKHDNIRLIAQNPQFIRVTTVAHHFDCYHFNNDIGLKNCRKKKNEPFTLIFHSPELAEKFVKGYII